MPVIAGWPGAWERETQQAAGAPAPPGLGARHRGEGGLLEGGGGRRVVKLDFLTISLCKTNIRGMMKVSRWPDQRPNPDPLHARGQ